MPDIPYEELLRRKELLSNPEFLVFAATEYANTVIEHMTLEDLQNFVYENEYEWFDSEANTHRQIDALDSEKLDIDKLYEKFKEQK